MCSKTILNFDIKYGQFSAKAPQKLTEAKHPCSSNCEVSTEVRHSPQLKSHVSNDAPLVLASHHLLHMIYTVQDKNGSKRPKEASAPLPDMSKFAARGSKHCSAFLFQLTTGKNC